MISGIVTAGHAIVTVMLRIPNRTDIPIQFVVDTGFNGELCLPPEAVSLLQLRFKFSGPANLANNSQVNLSVHDATIVWNGEERDVEVLATGQKPLLGADLLDEHELVVQFTEGGLVTIDPL
jgi:clan AA aspartic protease